LKPETALRGPHRVIYGKRTWFYLRLIFLAILAILAADA
jgi:hypothetical protein